MGRDDTDLYQDQPMVTFPDLAGWEKWLADEHTGAPGLWLTPWTGTRASSAESGSRYPDYARHWSHIPRLWPADSTSGRHKRQVGIMPPPPPPPETSRRVETRAEPARLPHVDHPRRTPIHHPPHHLPHLTQAS